MSTNEERPARIEAAQPPPGVRAARRAELWIMGRLPGLRNILRTDPDLG